LNTPLCLFRAKGITQNVILLFWGNAAKSIVVGFGLSKIQNSLPKVMIE